jgi:hypothetical protein
MTTFTLQDLNQLPNTPEEDEAMRELFEKMGQDLTAQHAPVPQPSEMGEPLPKPQQPSQPSQVNPEALIEHMVAQFSTNLRLLLTTIITQPKAQPEEAQGNSLQECVETTLEQARWFKEMVEQHVAERVESEVEDYFQHGFDPTNYFDFADAVSSEVYDRIDDAVRDQIDEAVADKVEEAVVERMQSIRVVFD